MDGLQESRKEWKILFDLLHSFGTPWLVMYPHHEITLCSWKAWKTYFQASSSPLQEFIQNSYILQHFFFFYVLILMMYSKRKDRYFIGHYTNHSVYMPQFFIWHWKMTLGMSPHKKKKKVLIPQNHTSFVQSNWTTSLCLYVGVTSTLSHHSISPPVKSIFFFQQHQSVGQSLLSNPFSIDTVIRFIHYLSFL